MLKMIVYKFFNKLRRILKSFFFLKFIEKDTPEDTLKFYNRMKYFYNLNLKKESFIIDV